MGWLADDLAATKRPTLILSHIPILSITPVVGRFDSAQGAWQVSGSLMTKNEEALRDLFQKHRHVKIALSGHTHMVDRLDYHGVSYLCGGAVCGAWWEGPNAGFDPGYRILDLYPDGSFRDEYIAWGWTA